ncbi:MAG: thiamine-phosphate kinase [Cyanobacteria bacterium J06635_15]
MFVPTVQDLGEVGLLAHLKQYCPPEAIGDDGALLLLAAGKSAVVSTDLLVDGVHFSDRTTTPFDVGWRATAANLSDLAAMGAEPIGITIALGLPGATPLDWLDGFYQGVVACLKTFGGVILGGDLCRSSTLTVSITALGQLFAVKALRRGAAQPGYAIVVTGGHGASRAGLELLLNPAIASRLNLTDKAALIEKHQRPRPRFDVLPTLEDCWRRQPANQGIAAMDSSDGLANAIVQLCQANGTGAILKRSQLPSPPCFGGWLDAKQAIDWTLYGGEDFELVLAMPPEMAETFVAALGPPVCIVGQMVDDRTVQLIDDVEATGAIELSLDQAFQHFSKVE